MEKRSWNRGIDLWVKEIMTSARSMRTRRGLARIGQWERDVDWMWGVSLIVRDGCYYNLGWWKAQCWRSKCLKGTPFINTRAELWWCRVNKQGCKAARVRVGQRRINTDQSESTLASSRHLADWSRHYADTTRAAPVSVLMQSPSVRAWAPHLWPLSIRVTSPFPSPRDNRNPIYPNTSSMLTSWTMHNPHERLTRLSDKKKES